MAMQSIFKSEQEINSIASKISLQPFIEELLRNQEKLPRFPYNHYTIFHSNCLWESIKKKAEFPSEVEIYLSSTKSDPMHFIWKKEEQFFHFRRAFGGPRTEVFLEGYIEPYPATDKIDHLIRVDTFLEDKRKTPLGIMALELSFNFYPKKTDKNLKVLRNF